MIDPIVAAASNLYCYSCINQPKGENGMKRFTGLFAALMLIAPAALAYQVTGPVLEVTDTKIVVEKDKEKWELGRDKDTKVKGTLKKGSTVTIQYKMTATSVEVRDAKKDTKADAKEPKKDSKDSKAPASK